MRGTLQLGRVGGVPVGIHWSWLIFGGLITWSLGISYPVTFPEVAGPAATAAAALTAGLFLLSVLGHELAHAWVAQARGVPVRRITLFILGGAAEIEREPNRPRDEFWITVVGPLASLGIGLGAGAVALVGQGVPVLHAVAATTALVNVSLALFNLLPGFPLDGGRIVRAILWGALHDYVRASRIATGLGQLVGWGLVAGGLLEVLVMQQGLGGLWTAGIGWYLSGAAQASYQQVLLQQAVQQVSVGQVMRPTFAWVYAGTQAQEAVSQYFLRQAGPGLPVMRDGALVGLVTLAQIQAIARARWATTPVEMLMTPRAQLVTLAPSASAAALLPLLQRPAAPEVLVLDAGRLVGLVTQDDLLQFLAQHPQPAAGRPLAQPGAIRG